MALEDVKALEEVVLLGLAEEMDAVWVHEWGTVEERCVAVEDEVLSVCPGPQVLLACAELAELCGCDGHPLLGDDEEVVATWALVLCCQSDHGCWPIASDEVVVLELGMILLGQAEI